MTFKIHDKLNRLTELCENLQQTGEQISEKTAYIKCTEKELDLLLVHYMQTEMEYGKLIGEFIDHLAAIETLLQKLGEAKVTVKQDSVVQNFFVIKRSDGCYWGGTNWEWVKDKNHAYGFDREEKAWEYINGQMIIPDLGSHFRYKPVLFYFYDAAGALIPDPDPNSEF